jgi:hypothetical protein
VDRTNGDGFSNDVPWASVFDSAANIRALSAIQAEGFRAASELVDRFVRIASAGLNGIDRSGTSATPANGDQRADLFGATGLEPLVTSWWSMVDQFLRASATRGVETQTPGPATLDLSTGQATGRLQLIADERGAATAEVWLRNDGPDDLGKVRLRCSDLLAHDGAVIPAHMLRFEPDIVPMPARSSRGVTVEVEIGDDVAPGSYRGMLLADGHPDVWLPIELAINPLVS